MPKTRVAVLIESSRAYGRGLIEGVVRYSREHGDWCIDFEPRGLDALPLWVDRWNGDGILARLSHRSLAEAVAAKGIPMVELFATTSEYRTPMVAGDNALIVRLAFEHLWERGLRQFGFCGMPPDESRYILERQEAFCRLVEDSGSSCAVFPARASVLALADWEKEQERIAAWLQELPKPVGVMACFDERGFQVLNACRLAQLQVPEEVAVIGVGNDVLLCEMGHPPLSSIDLDAPRIGYAAAVLLDRLMRGSRPPRQPLRLDPRGLVARRSTDMLATDDPDLAGALQFIREHACEGIHVEDVLEHVAVSQSVLERKFRSFLGRTPKVELLRVQMTRARELLSESNLSLKEVARHCGFRGEKYFSDAFFRQCGVRPTAYRQGRRERSG